MVALIKGKGLMPRSRPAAVTAGSRYRRSHLTVTAAGGDLGFNVATSLPPIGTCQAYAGNQDVAGLLGGIFPTLGGGGSSTPLDAGNQISVTNSSGPYGSDSALRRRRQDRALQGS